MGQIDYYLVLGVDEQATDADLRKAYVKRARKYHPDLNPGDTRAAARFRQVAEAYAVLSDSSRRAAYTAAWRFPDPGPAPLAPGLPTTPMATRVPGHEALPHPGAGDPARFGVRIAAALVDCMVLVLGFVAFQAVLGLVGAALGLSDAMDASTVANDFLTLTLLFFPVYFITTWSFFARTVGCMVFGMRLQTSGGGKPMLAAVVIRSVGSMLSTVPLLLGFLWALWDGNGLMWHDHLSGTVVVREVPWTQQHSVRRDVVFAVKRPSVPRITAATILVVLFAAALGVVAAKWQTASPPTTRWPIASYTHDTTAPS
ncbi:MAG TPA: DnaJ domain-containing protein [Chloroflexota bacterium]|nr:DnaJ domain-containing protein [Chloroflexota bacterium]